MSLLTKAKDLTYCLERDFSSFFPYLGRQERTIFLTLLKGIIISLIIYFPLIKGKYEFLMKMTVTVPLCDLLQSFPILVPSSKETAQVKS